MRVRELRLLQRTKEQACRIERRNQLMNERGSKRFWQQVAAIDAKNIAARLASQSAVPGTDVPTIDAFAAHFDSIACPPAFDWFDEGYRDLIRSVVSLSLRDVHTSSTWAVNDTDLRAFVQSMIAESRGQHVHDMDGFVRCLRDARVKLNMKLSMSEYRSAKERMHSGKAVGCDGLPFECIRGKWVIVDPETSARELISELDETMLAVFNHILASGKYPDAWRLAVLVPLLKGIDLDRSLPTNYRGIALLSCMSKLFANMLEFRLTSFQWETGAICDEQYGFTANRRTLDPIFILDTLIDSARANGSQLYVAFIDFEKAYDFVFQEGLFYKMLRANMVGPVYRIIHSMYESVSSIVRQGQEVSNVIYQHVGLRQGCILSPCLFSLFISDLPKFLADNG
jgi:hypothetical protein